MLRWVRPAPQGIGAGSEESRPAPHLTPEPRLGVLPGTFDPVTTAHLELARSARQEFRLQEVLFLIPEVLPHRQPEETSLGERLSLLEVALADYNDFSLAVATHGLFLEMARALVAHFPSRTRVYFLVGTDAAERVLRWDYCDRRKALRAMFSRFDLVVASRAGQLIIPDEPWLTSYRPQIHELHLPPDSQEISATRAREQARRGQPLTGLVPESVAAVIKRLGLYRSGRSGTPAGAPVGSPHSDSRC